MGGTGQGRRLAGVTGSQKERQVIYPQVKGGNCKVVKVNPSL